MTESERSLGQRWFERVWNEGRRDAIAEMMRPHTVLHDGASTTKGPEAFCDFFDRMGASFSGIHIEIEDTLAEGDRVCLRWSCTAKHTGQGLGEPTHKELRVTGISIMRMAAGEIVEVWQNWDMLGLMEQIQGAGRSPTYIAEGVPVAVA